MQKIPFTREGLAQLQSEYELLEKKRKPALDELKSAREKGDLSENSAYRANRLKLFSIDNRLRRIKLLLDKAYVVENKNSDFVNIGTYVTVTSEDSTSQTYRIVNTFESDLSANQISSFSPLGKTLMGKQLHDKISVRTPEGIKSFQITKLTINSS